MAKRGFFGVGPGERNSHHPAVKGGVARERFLENCRQGAARRAAQRRWQMIRREAEALGDRPPPPVTLPFVSIQHPGCATPPDGYRRVE